MTVRVAAATPHRDESGRGDAPTRRRAVRRVAPGLLAAAVGTAASACADGGATAPIDTGGLVERFGLEPLPAMVHPRDNQPDPQRIDLGRLLFFDPVMSGGHDVACATCHHPRFAMADGRALPLGPSGEGLGPARVLTDPEMVPEGRASPTVINVGFNRYVDQRTTDGFMFWDGRRRRLENLVTLPQREFSEMRGDAYPVEVVMDTLLARLRAIEEYEQLFRDAFPDKAAAVDAGAAVSAIDSLSMSQAISQFVRSLVGDDSPYDRFVAGDDGALTDAQKRGLVLFHTKGRCAECHPPPMFSDFFFHVVGAVQLGPGFRETPHEDFGRWIVTELESDRWKFRSPSLRNVAETAPYMHSGGYETLREVIEFFDRGGGDHPRIPSDRLDPLMRPLGLTAAEIEDLVAYLHALTDVPDVAIPERLPSGLEPPR